MESAPEAPRTLSERSALDSAAPMGYGATRSLERVAASLGLLAEAPLAFEPAWDVPQGGVLLALPSLLEQGLLRHTRKPITNCQRVSTVWKRSSCCWHCWPWCAVGRWNKCVTKRRENEAS